MLSNFGRSDGGRETWAYNFIPRLLERYPDLSLDVFGLTIDGEPDNREAVIGSVAKGARTRLSVRFVRAKADRVLMRAVIADKTLRLSKKQKGATDGTGSVVKGGSTSSPSPSPSASASASTSNGDTVDLPDTVVGQTVQEQTCSVGNDLGGR